MISDGVMGGVLCEEGRYLVSLALLVAAYAVVLTISIVSILCRFDAVVHGNGFQVMSCWTVTMTISILEITILIAITTRWVIVAVVFTVTEEVSSCDFCNVIKISPVLLTVTIIVMVVLATRDQNITIRVKNPKTATTTVTAFLMLETLALLAITCQIQLV